MKKRHENREPQNDQASYNPTGRNFDQADVSGRPEKINETGGERKKKKRTQKTEKRPGHKE